MIFDCGIAPGITNLLVGHVIERFEKIENGLIELGGFAADEKVPYGYSLTWNSKDLEEEYTRPATYIEEGVVLQKPALSELEVKNFPGNLKLESFLTDGLRSLTQQTDKIFNLKEKTLRWPGHIEALEPILKSGNLVKELHACIHTPDILIGVLTLDDISYELEVHHDDDMLYTDWNIPALSAMQNATAGACAAFARFVLENYIEPGVWYPEDLAQENPLYFDFIIKEFTKNKNIHLTEIKKKRL
jgi:saccharopine dehydrogenase-like NADP-dependent oxidoreductase